MIYYTPVKIIINDVKLAKVTFNIVVWQYSLFNLVI